ncbi:MAG: OprD family porin [Desulfobacterales bacterium]|nr:OprD family porin [Desulfobacterales bacterium]
MKCVDPRRRISRVTAWRRVGFTALMLLVTVPGFLALLPWGSSPALAQKAISQEQPIPSSVDEIGTTMSKSFEEEPIPSSVGEISTPMAKPFEEKEPRRGLLPWVKEKLKNTPAFFRDTKLNLNLRTYYFYRDNYPGATPPINEAWALGGALSYRSGWFLDHFRLGATLYTSQPRYAPDDRDGTILLKPGQHGYTVVGQLYGRVKLFEKHFVTIYRYHYDTPFINSDDGRMTPNTFEAYTFQGI